MFTTNSFIFLGASLTDPEIKLLLGYIHDAFQGGGPRHYALVEKSKVNAVELERWRKDFNIHVIPISDEDDYRDIRLFLAELV